MGIKSLMITLLITCFSTEVVCQSKAGIDIIKQLIAAEKYDEAIKRGDSLLTLKALSPFNAHIYKLQADAYYSLNNIEKSVHHYLLALGTPEINLEENKTTLEEVLSHAGFCYNELGLDEVAIEYYTKSLTVAEALSDSVEVAIGHFNIANSLLKLGHLDKAMEHLNMAYQIDVLRKDTAAIGFDLNAMGYGHLISGFPEKSIAHYRASINLLKASTGNQSSFGTRYNNLGNAFLAIRQWDSAAFYFSKSIEEHERHSDSLNLAERWISMANLNNQTKRFNTALLWANKAKKYFDQHGFNSQGAEINFSLIESYNGLGNQTMAMELIAQNIELTGRLGLLLPLRKAVLMEAELLAKSGRLERALQRYKYYNILNDSILHEQSQKKIHELEIKYKVDNVIQANKILTLEKDVAMADSQRKTMQLQWLMITLIIVIIAAALIAWILVSRHKLKQQLLLTEINALRGQIKLIMEGNVAGMDLSLDVLNKKLHTPLSDREFEILILAVGDLSNSEIADKTFVSVNTVKFHLKNIYEKLGVGNRKEALQFALQAKINP